MDTKFILSMFLPQLKSRLCEKGVVIKAFDLEIYTPDNKKHLINIDYLKKEIAADKGGLNEFAKKYIKFIENEHKPHACACGNKGI